ncbi:hypothetical protein [Polyangium aurulentum]|uniref:hypothetical protein n=1 Tax=Polyangium aurulentum TaxID=2567896 RepID=UPI0010ADAD88|nr:hypothetical protein [Polyangium aurulentum]UQA60732.1 hypothetical protein E8A73_009725 [Polyangium aurulentum]
MNMVQHERSFVLGALAGLSLLCAACGSSEEPVPLGTAFAAPPSAGEDMTIRIEDGHVFNGEPAAIEVVAPLPGGASAAASISLSTVDLAGQGLSVSFDLPPHALVDHDFIVEIGRFPGAGTLAHLTSGGARLINAGKLLLQARDGRISGSFRSSDEQFPSGTIEGRYEIACLVPPEHLGLAPNGTVSDGAWMLVEDEARTSDFCKAFREY